MVLKDIVPDFYNENSEIECKARLDRNNYLGWLKTVGGFANAKGGVFYIGVENKDYKLIGFNENEIDKEKLYFYQIVQEHIKIHLDINTETIPYLINEKTRYILKIIIKESLLKPVIIRYEGMPLIYIRRDGYTSPINEEEIRRLSLSSKEIHYDNELTNIKFDINDFKKMNNFFKIRNNNNKDIDIKSLGSIGFYDDNLYLKKGSYLFSDSFNDAENNTKIVCNQFKNTTRGDDIVLTSETFKGNLIDGFNFIFNFVNNRMNHGFIKKDDYRVDIDSFPKRALFEAIINSLAHRDYFIENSQISVDLFKNRLTITSPGSFYGNEEIKPTYKLESFLSKRRNELISSIFVYLKAMEAKGTGFEKIVEEYKDQDERHKPFIFSKNNQFSIVLPDITFEDGLDIEEETLLLTKSLINKSKYDLPILSFCYDKAKSINEITKHLNISNSTYFRNAIIKNLVDNDLLLTQKDGNTKFYLTNKEFVKLK